MLALLPLSSGLVVNQASLLRAGSFDARPRAPIMGAPNGATRDPEPGKQNFDNDMSGWKPPGGGGGGHAMGGDASKFVGTDTPDFLPDEGSDLAGLAAGISYTDGMQGSRECASACQIPGNSFAHSSMFTRKLHGLLALALLRRLLLFFPYARCRCSLLRRRA